MAAPIPTYVGAGIALAFLLAVPCGASTGPAGDAGSTSRPTDGGKSQLLQAVQALQNGKYDEALELSQKFIRFYPQRWQGYFLKGAAENRLKRYTAARETLETAMKMSPGELGLAYELSRAYAEPALAKLGEQIKLARRADGREARSREVLQNVLDDLRKAQQALDQITRGTVAAKARLDLLEAKGRNLSRIGIAAQILAREYDGLLLSLSSQLTSPERREFVSKRDQITKEAAEAFSQATAALLQVVREDASRGIAAAGLYGLAKEQGDEKTLAEVRQIILNMKDAPVIARLAIVVDDLAAVREKGAPDKAELAKNAKILDDLIADDPTNLTAKRLRASLALLLNDLPTTESLCNQILTVDPNHRYARLLLAKVLMLRGKLTQAEETLAKLRDDFSQWDEAHLAYAEAAAAAGKKDQAIEAINKAKALNPKNPRADRVLELVNSGKIAPRRTAGPVDIGGQGVPAELTDLIRFVESAKKGNKEQEARAKLEEMRKTYSAENARPEVLWGVAMGYHILGAAEDEAEAEKITRQIAEFKPVDSKGRMAVATALLALKRGSEAESILNVELQKSPDNARAYYAMGRLYTSSARRVQALEMYRRAVELDNANAEFRLELAKGLFDSGDLDGAQGVLKDLDPANEGGAILRMQIAMAQGRPVDVEEILPKLAESGKSSLILAILSLRGRKLQQCVDICQAELKKKEPTNPASFRVILAQAYLLDGRRDQAVAELKTLLESQPTNLSVYRMLVKVLAAELASDKVRAELTKIPSADENLADLAVGAMLVEQEKYGLARVVFERVAERAGAPEDYRYRARLLLADSLARENRLDDALKQLELLRGKADWHKHAMEASARLEIGANRFDAAAQSLQELRKIAADTRDGGLLRRVAGMYLAMKKPAEAMAIAQQLLGMLPDDARTYLVRADVLMAEGKKDEAADAIKTAIEKQPGNFSIYTSLARLLDQDDKRMRALGVLDQLAARGEAGQSAALAERGRLLASWGLHAPAAEAFQQLAKQGYTKNPSLRLQLGRALAALGHKDQARTELGGIPAYAQEYVAAQLLLGELAAGIEESLRIVDALDKARPDTPEVLTEKLGLLARAERWKDLAKIVSDRVAAKKPLSAQAAALGVQAMIATGDHAAAANLCVGLAQQNNQAPWRELAAMLLSDKPAESAKLLPEVQAAGVYDAVLGLCLAVAKSDPAEARKWHGRINELDGELAKQTPPRSVPTALKLLASLAAGAAGQANQEAAKIVDSGFADSTVAKELVAHAGRDAAAGAQEAALLLKADMALALRAGQLGRDWAMKALEARPTCLWAAVLLVRGGADSPTRAKALKLLQPSDSPVAQAIGAAGLMADHEYDKAVAAYTALSKAFPDDLTLQLQAAMAAERAGRLDDAFTLYSAVLDKTGNPVAANNAAYLVALRYPRDQAKLAKAEQWTQKALKLAPNMSALRDTVGWIAHLQGRDQYALGELRQAVRAAPGSIENHYHLGVVEKATGNEQLAKWHLEAAVALAKKAQDDKQTLPASALEAAKSAAQEINAPADAKTPIVIEPEKPKEPDKPKKPEATSKPDEKEPDVIKVGPS